jgi:large subunit ribosomal protein L6
VLDIELQGEEIVLSLGYSHPVKMNSKEISEVVQNTTINLKSCDKALLGLFAANIRAWRQPEPYKGKEFYIKVNKFFAKLVSLEITC